MEFFNQFSISSNKNKMCNHWVEVRNDSSNFGLPGYRFCGDTKPNVVILSSAQQMLITFRSLDLNATDTDRKGFQALLQPGMFLYLFIDRHSYKMIGVTK